MLSTIFFLINEENLLKIITLNKLVKEKAATRPDILALFGLGNFNLIREKYVTTMLTTTNSVVVQFKWLSYRHFWFK